MARKCSAVLAFVVLAVVLAGCVERELTITTVPTGSMVLLNDEEVGTTPVTTSFQWYGDYRVRVSKPGYETLVTHKNIKRPLDDVFPFDFFAGVLWPGKIRHHYTWDFELAPAKEMSRAELMADAMALRAEALKDVNEPNAVKGK